MTAMNNGAGDKGKAPATTFFVPAEHPAIAGHFPGDPIVPAVLILSQVAEAIAERFPGVVLGTLQNARFHQPLRPGEDCLVETEKTGDRIVFKVRLSDGTAAEPLRAGGRGVEANLVAGGQWLCRSPSATP